MSETTVAEMMAPPGEWKAKHIETIFRDRLVSVEWTLLIIMIDDASC